jgi:hypothetical protein
MDSVSGAIRAQIIDSESGNVIREFDVKPGTSTTFHKSIFLESTV